MHLAMAWPCGGSPASVVNMRARLGNGALDGVGGRRVGRLEGSSITKTI
jgi:hypothetical protein